MEVRFNLNGEDLNRAQAERLVGSKEKLEKMIQESEGHFTETGAEVNSYDLDSEETLNIQFFRKAAFYLNGKKKTKTAAEKLVGEGNLNKMVEEAKTFFWAFPKETTSYPTGAGTLTLTFE